MAQHISSRQLMTLSFVSMLSPFLRLIPRSIANRAGAAAWVCCGLSILPAAVLSFLISALLQHFPPRTGLAKGVMGILGRFLGALLLSLWSLWLIFHSGFLLSSGADRFIATIYPGIAPTIFILVTALLCLTAAYGEVKAIARAAELFQPLLLFVILLVLCFSLSEVEPTFLLPITKKQASGILQGIPIAAEAVSVVMVNAAFLSKFLAPDPKPHRNLPWLVGVTLLSLFFCGVSVGSLGKIHSSSLPYPFFIMARDLSILSGVERIEALVVGLWLLPDFVLIALELMIAADNFLIITNKQDEIRPRKAWITLAGMLAVVLAFSVSPSHETIAKLSDKIIPTIHLGWAYFVIPLLLICARLRKKL